jgi:hypothetical protein
MVLLGAKPTLIAVVGGAIAYGIAHGLLHELDILSAAIFAFAIRHRTRL